jgi:hypothetical protein
MYGRIVAESPKAFRRPVPIALTCLATVLFPAFLYWERRLEKAGKTCIMPLYVWKNKSFAAVCVAVFLAWAAFNGVQYFATLTYSPLVILISRTPRDFPSPSLCVAFGLM